jgi:hypothetical protein
MQIWPIIRDPNEFGYDAKLIDKTCEDEDSATIFHCNNPADYEVVINGDQKGYICKSCLARIMEINQ